MFAPSLRAFALPRSPKFLPCGCSQLHVAGPIGDERTLRKVAKHMPRLRDLRLTIS